VFLERKGWPCDEVQRIVAPHPGPVHHVAGAGKLINHSWAVVPGTRLRIASKKTSFMPEHEYVDPIVSPEPNAFLAHFDWIANLSEKHKAWYYSVSFVIEWRHE
jgi:hypothetical protein